MIEQLDWHDGAVVCGTSSVVVCVFYFDHVYVVVVAVRTKASTLLVYDRQILLNLRISTEALQDQTHHDTRLLPSWRIYWRGYIAHHIMLRWISVGKDGVSVAVWSSSSRSCCGQAVSWALGSIDSQGNVIVTAPTFGVRVWMPMPGIYPSYLTWDINDIYTFRLASAAFRYIFFARCAEHGARWKTLCR